MKKEPEMRGDGVADWTDDFDKHVTRLDKVQGKPRFIVDASVHVRDTMEVAWLAAQSVFEDKATPELALEMFKMIDAERQRLVKEEEEELRRRLEE